MVFIINKDTKKEEFDKKLSESNDIRKFDARKFCGIIKLKENPLEIQKKLRNEWE